MFLIRSHVWRSGAPASSQAHNSDTNQTGLRGVNLIGAGVRPDDTILNHSARETAQSLPASAAVTTKGGMLDVASSTEVAESVTGSNWFSLFFAIPKF